MKPLIAWAMKSKDGRSAIGPGRAEAADAGGDEIGLQRSEPRRVEAHLGQDARAEILDEHVAGGDQPGQHRPPLLRPQIERERALVAVEGGEVPREAVLDDALGAQRVADARRLHLDHLGPHVGQHHRAERPGQNARQVNDPDTR
jgi:hypothetical protein